MDQSLGFLVCLVEDHVRGSVDPVAMMCYDTMILLSILLILLLLYTVRCMRHSKTKDRVSPAFFVFVFSLFVCLKRRTVLRISVLFLSLLTSWDLARPQWLDFLDEPQRTFVESPRQTLPPTCHDSVVCHRKICMCVCIIRSSQQRVFEVLSSSKTKSEASKYSKRQKYQLRILEIICLFLWRLELLELLCAYVVLPARCLCTPRGQNLHTTYTEPLSFFGQQHHTNRCADDRLQPTTYHSWVRRVILVGCWRTQTQSLFFFFAVEVWGNSYTDRGFNPPPARFVFTLRYRMCQTHTCTLSCLSLCFLFRVEVGHCGLLHER